ncbi:unnamed protein product [Mytilus edulis]|uniref:Cadherin domain-containing protein n=1 Tax=Mytilus edulis TaxID=6550 RepID=A0A8S3UXL3_MYTED|nr:unnamed protein product [Mytilus edulis]
MFKTITTSTTTTAHHFKTETYPEYWYLFARKVVLMNAVLIINLCMKYNRPYAEIDKRTKAQKRADRIMAAQERKTKVRSDVFDRRSLECEQNRSLDYDNVVIYVTCTDGMQPSDEGHLMVYVIKNIPPEFTDLPREEILPQQSTSSDFTIPIVVTDADTATTSLSYAINCEPSASCPFSRTTTSTGADIKTTVDFSTIQVPAFDIHVTVNDGDTTVGSNVLSVYVENINDIPVFANAESDLKIGVEENTAVGTLLYTYFTTDLDSVDVVTYSWTPTTNSYFDIDSASGQISTIAEFDYDNLFYVGFATSFRFVVRATDTKDTATTTVTISIVNVNDVPTLSNTHYVLNDTENVGETLLSSPNIDASDPENETLRYIGL